MSLNEKTFIGVIHEYFNSSYGFTVERIEAPSKEEARDKVQAKAYRKSDGAMNHFSAEIIDPREYGFEQRS